MQVIYKMLMNADVQVMDAVVVQRSKLTETRVASSGMRFMMM